MHIKRRLAAIFLVAVLTALTIWGSSVTIPVPEEEAPDVWTSKKETMYIWYTDEALSNYINTAAIHFSDAENVRVIPVLKSNSAFLQEINSATFDPEQQMPDAYIINNDELEKAYLSGLACDIKDSGDTVTSQRFSSTAISAVTYQGHKAAYPFYYETSVLVYNKDYVNMWTRQQLAREQETLENQDPSQEEEDAEEPQEEEIPIEQIISDSGIPLTVDGLLHFADTFDAPEGVDGVMKWAVSDIFYNYWIVGAYLIVGGDCGDNHANVNINNQETIDCLQVYQNLNQFFYIEPETVSYESTIQDFMEGKLVFTIGTSELLERLDEAKESGEFLFDYGVAQLPQVSTKLDSRALSVTNAVAVNGYSKHKEIANAFAAYLTQEAAKDLFGKTQKLPAYPGAYGGDEKLQTFLKQYASSVSLPKMMEIGNLWLQLESLFSKVWNGEEVPPLVEELENQVFTQINVRKNE